jgi:dihydrofolate synthase/folylpolyglutamate synthase
MDYQEAIAFLYDSLPMFQKIGKAAFKKDLTNTLAFCARLGEPQHAFPSVHIAGTNGKGSSAHSIAAVLQAAGYKTGLYTSPHLKDFTERIRVNGQPISRQAVISFVEEQQEFILELQPSFFETTVAMAFDYFRQQQVDIAVIEVGMGGRLDSTNVIQPLVSLITHIGYDHMEFLGDSLDKIAGEKAGIIKQRVPVVIGERQDETTEVYEKIAREKKAPLYFAQDDYQARIFKVLDGQYTVDISRHGQLLYENLPIALGAHYQLNNLPGILQVLDLLNEMHFTISWEHIRQGLAEVTSLTGLKGRWQVIRKAPLTIADTGHNKGAFEAIRQQLQELQFQKLFMVLGFSVEKDLSSILPLLPADAHYLFCQAAIPRAMPSTTLQANAREYGLHGTAYKSVMEAYQKAQALAGPEDCIFIGGSTFVVAEIDEL